MELLNFEKKDLDELISFYKRFLNDGEELFSSIKGACEANEYFGSKAVDKGKTVGFFTFQKGTLFTCPHPELIKKVRDMAGDRNIVTVDSLMVLPEYRGSGVAKALAERNSELLRKRNIDLVMAESWIYPDGRAPSLKIYENMGEVLFKEKEPLFYKDAYSMGITCPICGDHCQCGAWVLLIKNRKSRD
ncbi:MAG: GNAT family N-acetyltransferase [Lachnospiraceae bacterium]|nr:GNAT family N-acetyltransferase [Lachnospiraceae bacterium]